MTSKILILPGDGIGPEIVAEAVKVLECLRQEHSLDVALDYGLIGGCAVDALGSPYPEATRRQVQEAEAILLGTVGGPKWASLDWPQRPESGLLALRTDLQCFANLRPAVLYPQLAAAAIDILPSASLNAQGKGLYEPIHGSAPDIAGKGIANPLATILSVAMLLRHSLNQPELAERVEHAVGQVLDQGLRTLDMTATGMTAVGTQAMGDAVVAAL
ncbi:MAG TPA: hypothetical protein DCS21_00340 [Gammaproteobacteria bacterium]|nr:hypothetical protein [Gammaproteobacteria bacterium]